MLRTLARKLPKNWKLAAVKLLEGLQSLSIRSAVREQRLDELMAQLTLIVPDIRQQYTTHVLEKPYVFLKVRALHAFQISLVRKALELLGVGANEPLTIVDIGDSAGTHLQYLEKLHGKIRSLSVNLDSEAVLRIRSKGLEAIHARAEDLHKYNISPDIFTSFETLEHLHAPLLLLQSLSKVRCRSLVVTVPYVAKSRVSLDYIRQGRDEQRVAAESVHIFELSPDDWRLLFQFSGWRILHDQVYHQYPTRHPLCVTKPIWKSLDFEGFYGAVLVPDQRWPSLYEG